jgi:hypothetical protein
VAGLLVDLGRLPAQREILRVRAHGDLDLARGFVEATRLGVLGGQRARIARRRRSAAGAEQGGKR